MVSFVMPIADNMGFERNAEVEPVTAKTTVMTKTCQFELIFHRSLKLDIPEFLANIG